MIHRISRIGRDRRDHRPADDAHDAFRGPIPVDDARQIDSAGDRVDAHQHQAETQVRRNSLTQPVMNRGRLNCAAEWTLSNVSGSLSIGPADSFAASRTSSVPPLTRHISADPAASAIAKAAEERRQRNRLGRQRPGDVADDVPEAALAAGRRGRRQSPPPRGWRHRRSEPPAAPGRSLSARNWIATACQLATASSAPRLRRSFRLTLRQFAACDRRASIVCWSSGRPRADSINVMRTLAGRLVVGGLLGSLIARRRRPNLGACPVRVEPTTRSPVEGRGGVPPPVRRQRRSPAGDGGAGGGASRRDPGSRERDPADRDPAVRRRVSGTAS